MKVILDVVLEEGTDKQEFVNSFDSETQADWWNMLESIPNVICMHVEESFIDEFKNDSRVLTADERPEYVSANLPNVYSMTKTITASTPSTTLNGGNFAPLQFYLDTNQISSSNPPVGSAVSDVSSQIANATYASRWTGKNVDIVTLEVGYNLSDLSPYVGYHNTHPDFNSLDTPGTTRMIPMNWTDLEDPNNIQVTSNSCLSAHGIGVLSAAAGTICGFAKRSSMRAAYITNEDGTTEIINAITAWHNAKAVNPDTGVKNPTIMIAEYQNLLDRRYAIKISDIASITDLNGTVNRPVGGWGTDFTPFTSRNIMPFQVYDSATTNYNWCVVFPYQSRFTAQQVALQNAWDAGIVCINAAGNNGGVYVKTSDPRYNGVYCTTSGTIDVYDVLYYSSTISKSTSTSTTWYPFIPYGPHGEDKGIDVAAGYNSESNSILDPYSNRGPGIDIVGLGSNTWTSYPQSTYADGFEWGMFSGTSCATPTVVGKAACLMERYFYYKGVWPTPNQVKTLLTSSAKKIVRGVKSTNWSNVSAATSQINTDEGGVSIARISSGTNANGGFKLTDLAGTTNLRAFFDELDFNNENTHSRRNKSGLIYPRRSMRTGNFVYPESNATIQPSVNITVTSTSFTNGSTIPSKHRFNGGNTSPALSWSATGDTSFISYWAVFGFENGGDNQYLWDVDNIPVETTSILENGSWPSGTVINTVNASQRSNGYYGIAPTSNTLRTYFFYVVAYRSNGTYIGLGYISGTHSI